MGQLLQRMTNVWTTLLDALYWLFNRRAIEGPHELETGKKETHRENLQNPKFKNWVKGGLALKYLQTGLSEFVQSIANTQHQKMLDSTGIAFKASCKTCTIKSIKPLHNSSDCPRVQNGCNCALPDTRKCPNKICDTMYEEIMKHLGPNRVYWKNTHIRKWTTDPWEVAKCYILAPGYSKKHCAAKTDGAGLLHLLINNNTFRDHVNCKINFIKKLQTESFDITTENVLDVLKEAQATIAKTLEEVKLKQEQEAQSSRQEYQHAQSEIKQLQEKANNLKETQQLILKDMEEMKTRLGSDGAEANNKQSKVTTMDEEYIKKRDGLQKALTEFYRSNYRKISVSHVQEDLETDVIDFYVRPPIQASDPEELYRIHRGIATGTQVTSYKQMLIRDNGQPYKNIYLTAKPGVGKTTFCTHLSAVWCQAHNLDESAAEKFDNDDIQALMKYQLAFFINLREVHESHCEVDKMIKHFIKDRFTVDVSKKFLKKMLVDETCLVVLDGLDEWNHSKTCKVGNNPRDIPHQKQRANFTVLTTTRSWKLDVIRLKPSEYDRRLDIHELDDTMLRELETKVRKVFNRIFGESRTADAFSRAMEITDLGEMRHSPYIHLLCLCLCFSKEGIGKSKCQIYANITEATLERQTNKFQTEFLKRIDKAGVVPLCFKDNMYCNQHMALLRTLGKMACHSILNKENRQMLVMDLKFVGKYLTNEKLKYCLKLGLLTQNKDYDNLLRRVSNVSFPHKTVHEFYCAVYIRSTSTTSSDPESDVTNSCPGSYQTSSRPGSDVTSSHPGSDVTSSSPGSDVTNSCPGSYQTSSRPGSDVTSSGHGSDETSSRPGSDVTSSRPGSDETSSGHGSDETSARPGSDVTSSRSRSYVTSSRPGSDVTSPRSERETVQNVIVDVCSDLSKILEISAVLIFLSGLDSQQCSQILKTLSTVVTRDSACKAYRARADLYDTKGVYKALFNFQTLLTDCACEMKLNGEDVQSLPLEDLIINKRSKEHMSLLQSILQARETKIKTLDIQQCVNTTEVTHIFDVLDLRSLTSLEKIVLDAVAMEQDLQDLLQQSKDTLRTLFLRCKNYEENFDMYTNCTTELSKQCTDMITSLQLLQAVWLDCLLLSHEQWESIVNFIKLRTTMTEVALWNINCKDHKKYSSDVTIDLSGHKNLERLTLHNVPVSQLKVNNQRLQYCWIGKLPSSVISSWFQSLPTAHNLHITCSHLSEDDIGVMIETIPALLNLTTLEVHYMNLGDFELILPEGMTKLEYIGLWKVTLTSEGLQTLVDTLSDLAQSVDVVLLECTVLPEDEYEAVKQEISESCTVLLDGPNEYGDKMFVFEKESETEDETESETEDETENETEDGTKRETEDGTEREPEHGTASETEDRTEGKTEDETERETEDGTERETEDGTERETEDRTEGETEDETERETEDETERETEDGTERETEHGTESETDDRTEGETEDETERETEDGTERETEDGTEGESEDGTDREKPKTKRK